MVNEEFDSTHGAAQSFGTEVVHNVRKSDCRVNSDSPGASRQQVGLGQAETGPDGQGVTGSVDLSTETDAIRIVANGVSDPIKKLDCPLGFGLSFPGGLLSEFLYCRILEIEEFRGFQKLIRGLWKTLGEKDNEYCSLVYCRRLLSQGTW